MERHKKIIQSQKGQSIVIIAIVMVALLALAGLAIDGGNLYLQRRRAQNASDTAALVGTRILAQLMSVCETPDGDDDAQIEELILQYAASNGFSEPEDGGEGTEISAWYVDADTVRQGEVGVGSIPAASTGVEVRIDAKVDTYFMRVVGYEQGSFAADATAMAGEVQNFGGGLLPIAVPQVVADDPNLNGGDDFLIIENNHHEGGMFCRDVNGNGVFDEGIDVCIGDPTSANAHRGWLNFNYMYNQAYVGEGFAGRERTLERSVPNRGCGSDDNTYWDEGVRGWAGDDDGACLFDGYVEAGNLIQFEDDEVVIQEVGGVLYPNGDFIHGSPGARTSSLHSVVDYFGPSDENPDGRLATIPVFDYIFMSDYMDDNFEDPEIGWPRAGGGGHAFLYHIIGFVAVRISDDCSTDHNLSGQWMETKIIPGEIVPSAGVGAGMCRQYSLFGVTLWE